MENLSTAPSMGCCTSIRGYVSCLLKMTTSKKEKENQVLILIAGYPNFVNLLIHLDTHVQETHTHLRRHLHTYTDGQ